MQSYSLTIVKLASTLSFLLVCASAQAGVVELGASANFRTSKINADNFQESLSYTGSFSYYFWEMSALELSYTNGTSLLSVKASATDPKLLLQTEFELVGLDLVITFAGRSAALQPYAKVGGAYIKKKITRKPGDDPNDFPTEVIESPEGLVPSAGVGFKIKVTQAFAFKTGVDVWTNPLNEEPRTYDWAGRAGITWMF